MYALGQYTRERYQNFLPPIYPSRNLRLYSTDFERCITSAQLYAAGLYPPIKEEVWNDDLKWNPIPVFIAEEHVIRGIKRFCPTYMKEYLKVRTHFLEEFKKDPLSEYITKHSGLGHNNYSDFGYLYDTLAVQESLGLKLPEWTKKVYPDYMKQFHLNSIDIFFFTENLRRLCK